jgi:DNA primase
MEFYWGEALIENVAKYKNPTRNGGDRNGTCYFSNRGVHYYLVDKSRTDGYGLGKSHINCFDFVMWHHSCSFREALERINYEMNVQQKPIKHVVEEKKTDPDNRVGVAFKVITRPYTQSDLDYWQQFSISPKTLRDFKVKCVEKCYTNAKNKTRWELVYKKKGTTYKDSAFVYLFGDRVKLYQPYSQFTKWKSNTKSSDIYGLDLLPIRGKTLYIASGCKDAMCLYEAGLDVIAPQSENAGISVDLMNKLKTSFRHIIVLYDNDETGLKQSELFVERHNTDNNVHYITLPNEHGKDVAEIVNKTNLDYVLNLVTDLTDEVLNELTNGSNKQSIIIGCYE